MLSISLYKVSEGKVIEEERNAADNESIGGNLTRPKLLGPGTVWQHGADNEVGLVAPDRIGVNDFFLHGLHHEGGQRPR